MGNIVSESILPHSYPEELHSNSNSNSNSYPNSSTSPKDHSKIAEQSDEEVPSHSMESSRKAKGTDSAIIANGSDNSRSQPVYHERDEGGGKSYSEKSKAYKKGF